MKVLNRFFKTININRVENIQIVGTAALRDADNSEEIIKQIQKKFDVEVEIVSGVAPNRKSTNSKSTP